MEHYSDFDQWYEGSGSDSTGVAGKAFINVKNHLEKNSSLNAQEQSLVASACSIEDVQKVIFAALAKYQDKSSSRKTTKWLRKTSEIICHYDSILEVFIQQHPEYVSLAWGTMKLLFVSVVNHGETLKLLAKSISKVGERLPRVKILSKLYPTERMRQTVESLYSCILEFLLLAHGWCTESKFQHFYHSLTRPPELRYNDVLERISDCSDDLLELAALGSQAEIRVMHGTQQNKLDSIISNLKAVDRRRQDQAIALEAAIGRLEVAGNQREQKLDIIISLLKASGITIDDLVEKTEAFHSIQTSAQLNTNQMLSDLQMSQILASFSQSFEDPDKCLRHHVLLCRRRARTATTTIGTNKFWLSPKLTEWSSKKESSLTIVKGNFPSRPAIQDFAVDLIQALAASAIPTAWALESSNASAEPHPISTTADVAKYLIYQVLRLRVGGAGQTEKQLALRYSQFHTARTSREWLGLLEHVCKDMEQQIYLVLDLATVRDPSEGAEGLEFVLELDRLLRQWSEWSTATPRSILKVVLLVYEEAWSRILPDQVADSTVCVRTTGRKRQLGNMKSKRSDKSGFLNTKSRLGRAQGRLEYN